MTPVRKLALVPSVTSVRVRSGSVVVNAAFVLRNAGSIPERGTLAWRIVDPAGRTVGTGRRPVLVQPGARISLAVPTWIGTASARRTGTYRLVVRVDTPGRGWTAPTIRFRQPY